MSHITDNLLVSGNLTVTGTQSIERTDIAAETATIEVPLTDLRVHDAFQTVLPNPSATDDLGLYGGTFGTGSPQVMTYDVKSAGAVTLYARFLVTLPYNYVSAGTVAIRAHAGMETTIADTSCTLDCEVHKSDEEGGAGSDLCTTSAIDINSLTHADRDFTVNSTGLVAGDMLDVRLTVAVNDGAGVAVVQAALGSVQLRCSVKG